MFGIIEKRLADIAQINYVPYNMNSGAEAAIVERDIFLKIYETLQFIYTSYSLTNELDFPKFYNSDIVGLKMILHRFYFNDDVLDGITTGVLKATDVYAFILGIGSGDTRFNVDQFSNDFKNRMLMEVVATAREEDNNNLLAEPATTTVSNELEIEEKPTIFNKVIDCIFKGSYDRVIINEDKYKVIIIGNGYIIEKDKYIDIAQKLEKNIVIITNWALAINRYIKKCNDFDINELEKDFLFIYTKPSEFTSKFSCKNTFKSLCFGKDVKDLFVINDQIKKEFIEKINNDETLNSDERRNKLEEYEKQPSRSPYSDYDLVLKDTITNIVWAVKDRCFFYFLIPQNVENIKIFQTIQKELVDRLLRKISFLEIIKRDAIYHKSLIDDNMEDYVKFAIATNSSILEELKERYKEAKESYEDHLQKALESGKLLQKYADQIESFDEIGHFERERTRAIKNFQDTMNLSKVSSIFVKNKTVHVYTHNLYAMDQRTKKWHDIGTFHISLGMQSNTYSPSESLRIKNTKHQIHGLEESMEAPHVFPTGLPCHGNLLYGMTQAYKKRDLFQLILQIIGFLESANTDDAAGKFVNKWPEVPEEVAKINEKYELEKQIEKLEMVYNDKEKKYDDQLDLAIPLHI